MGKSLAALLALLLCAAILLTAAVTAVSQGETDISVTERTLTGDPEAAHGLTVETFQNLDRQLFWHTTYLAGVEPEVSTEFTYTLSTRSTQQEQNYYADFSVGTGGFGISGSNITPDDVGDLEMMEPVWDVASRTGAGETCTESIQLNRYYDYFTVSFTGSGFEAHRQKQEWVTFLTDYFKIPVPDQVHWEVTVEKNALGQVTMVNCSEKLEEQQSFSGWADCVFLGTDLYFLVRGNLDVSQIEGGYGIYRIPGEIISEYEGVAITPQLVLKIKELENIYPLDPTLCDQVALVEGPGENTLLLMRQMSGQVRVRVLDAAAGEDRQELLLEGGELPEVWRCGELVAFVQDRKSIQAYVLADGLLTRWMADALYPLTDTSAYYSPILAFDGDRLAIAASRSLYISASSRVLVYDSTGLRYAGDYTYSCDSLGAIQLASYNWVDPLQLHWQ